MKKIIVLISILFLAIQANAQDFYNNETRITAGGITFNIIKQGSILNIDNATNHLVDENWQYLDGKSVDPGSDNTDYLNAYATFDLELMKKALKETFTEAEYNRLRKAQNSGFSIYFVLDRDGNIIELSFILNTRENPELELIPPQKYAMLEKNIKKYIKWQTNKYAKKFSFFHASCRLQFTNIPIDFRRRPTVSLGR